jgi:hypothetical protein
MAKRLPPLLYSRPPHTEFIVAVVVPIAFGVLTGLVLGWSGGVYALLLVLAALGGLGAGLEHDAALEGTYRGLLGGLLFTTGILVAHGLADVAPKTKLPDPESLLLVINATVGMALGTLGARWRVRLEAGRPAPGTAAP